MTEAAAMVALTVGVALAREAEAMAKVTVAIRTVAKAEAAARLNSDGRTLGQLTREVWRWRSAWAEDLWVDRGLLVAQALTR